MNISNEVKALLQANLFKESYSEINHEYQYGGKNEIDFSIQPQHVIDKAEIDLAIINKRAENYAKRDGFKVGACIKLPDGQQVIISHVWDDTVQTSHGGSMHISDGGGLSFSGSLDSGIKKSDLILTDETEQTGIWIFHQGFSGGGRGVDYNIPVQVYRTKEGADLSGIPQVKALQKKLIKEQSETITRINGNGQPYTLHLPELRILHRKGSDSVYDTVKEYPKEDCVISGLSFDADGWGNLTCQPMKLAELNKLLKENNFTAKFYNNCGSENMLYLTPTSSNRDACKQFPEERKLTHSF